MIWSACSFRHIAGECVVFILDIAVPKIFDCGDIIDWDFYVYIIAD
jgi:hypothetical protein